MIPSHGTLYSPLLLKDWMSSRLSQLKPTQKAKAEKALEVISKEFLKHKLLEKKEVSLVAILDFILFHVLSIVNILHFVVIVWCVLHNYTML